MLKCKCGYVCVPKPVETKPAEVKPEEPVDAPEAKSGLPKVNQMDVTTATYLDVAVLRCLFISQWLEEGIFWALKYLYQRYASTVNSKVCIILFFK